MIVVVVVNSIIICKKQTYILFLYMFVFFIFKFSEIIKNYNKYILNPSIKTDNDKITKSEKWCNTYRVLFIEDALNKGKRWQYHQ